VKENDRVVTIGGIYGVVTNVQRDADRVTIRVDEATGAKLKINMSAIARVLTAEEQESSAAPSK
jgi:preprotein translocase subunit YajC